MIRTRIVRHLAFAAATVAAASVAFVGSVSAEPAAPAAPIDIDWHDAAMKLRAVAAGNPEAEAAMDRLIASPLQPKRMDAALPAQPFAIPAYSDTGRLDPATGQLYGSGIALGVDGFRFGFFGGPGTISPNQNGAALNVIWLNLANGRSGTDLLWQHQDVTVDTTIRTNILDPGAGPIVAAVYGSLWHRWPVPVDDQHKDGFAYVKSTIFWPSMGSVLG